MDSLKVEYFKKLNGLNEKDYLYNTIRYCLAPTLYNLKCSTLLNFTKQNKNIIYYWIKYREEILYNFGLKCVQLKANDESITELFYNDALMENRLKRVGCVDFLNQFGYGESYERDIYLNLLKERFNNKLPHEIGLFLDFPLWDVVDYIKNCGKNYIYCGYWKVYRNINYAMKTFEKYNKAKLETLLDLKINGCSKI